MNSKFGKGFDDLTNWPMTEGLAEKIESFMQRMIDITEEYQSRGIQLNPISTNHFRSPYLSIRLVETKSKKVQDAFKTHQPVPYVIAALLSYQDWWLQLPFIPFLESVIISDEDPEGVRDIFDYLDYRSHLFSDWQTKLKDKTVSLENRVEDSISLLRNNTGTDKILDPRKDWDLEFWIYQWRWLYLEENRLDLAISTLEELANTIWESLEVGLIPKGVSLLTSLGLLHLERNDESESKIRFLQALTLAARLGEEVRNSSPWISLCTNFDVTTSHLSNFLGVISEDRNSSIKSLAQKLKRLSTMVDIQVFFDRIVDVDKPAIDGILSSITQSSISPPKRGLIFEQMSRDLLEAIEGFQVKSLRTKTGQLDGVVINHRADHPFFLELGHYFLMEAKNWKKPVSAKEVRSFLDKMREHKCNFGVIFSTSGVSGPDGENATGRIQSAFHEGYKILVLDESDLKDIVSCQNIIQILRKKYEALKFQT